MSNFEIVKSEPMSAVELREQVNIINNALRSVMIRGSHYDVLPGCGKKPVLLKPGAEKILSTFHIGVEVNVEDLGDGYDFRYRVTCRGFFIPTGNTVGYGVGEASTREKKYMWRAALCQEEFDTTPETKRQIAFISRSGQIEKVLQVRQSPSDIANTVLKMAKKRAMVDLCLTATACSDIFEQDLDDPDTAEAAGAQPRYTQPQRNQPPPRSGGRSEDLPQTGGNTISEAQAKRLWAIGKGKGLSEAEIGFVCWEIGGINDSREIPRDKYEAVISALQSATPGNVIPPEAQ